MFKDLKKLSDQGKEMSKQQGRPTSMLGMMKDMPNQINQATAAVDDAMAMQADMQKQQALLQTGTPAKASVKSMQDTGTLVNFNPQIILELEVTVEGKDPYPVQLSTPIPQMMLAQITPGKTVGVRVDPADPSSLAIDWSQPPA
jgi:hypothetical protein